MDDHASVVVGPAHEVGVWRGPANRPWLRRIAHGAGFTNQWDLNRLEEERAFEAQRASELDADRHVTADAAPDAAPAIVPDEWPSTRSLRMWWLPSARDR